MELTEVDTEYLLEHFHELNDGPMASLAVALRDLNALPEVLAPAEPPLYPSAVEENVVPFKKPITKSITTALIAIAIVGSTTLGAAALTGVGPKPLVNFAKSTFKATFHAVSTITSKVVDLVVAPLQENTNSAPQPQQTEQTQGTGQQPNPVPDPTPTMSNVSSPPGATSNQEASQGTKQSSNTSTQDVKHEVKHEVKQEATHAPEVSESTQAHEKATTPETESNKKPEVKQSEKPEVKQSEAKTVATPEPKSSEKVEVKSAAPTASTATEKPSVEKTDTPEQKND